MIGNTEANQAALESSYTQEHKSPSESKFEVSDALQMPITTSDTNNTTSNSENYSAGVSAKSGNPIIIWYEPTNTPIPSPTTTPTPTSTPTPTVTPTPTPVEEVPQ